MIKAGHFPHASGDLSRLFFDLPNVRAMILHQREGNQRHHAIGLNLQKTLHEPPGLEMIETNVSN
jgi:hypothetical protein